MLINELLRNIAPETIDAQILAITGWYLTGLLSIFILFSAWILLRVLIRWGQLAKLYISILYASKKHKGNLDSLRPHLHAKLIKRMGWAKIGLQSFHLAWQEARPQGEDKAILPIRLREYLPPEVVLDGVRNRRIAEALPGIFVALGIFGTFLGLVLGLQNLEFGKLDNLQAGVGFLISGLSLAFLTSLGGIALSILFSIIDRFSITLLERSLFALDNLFAEIYPYDSQERYARRHHELQRDIKQGLQTLATDVATELSSKIGSKLAKALDDHLVPEIKNLSNRIEKQIEQNEKHQTDALKGFDERLDSLSKVINKHFEYSQERQADAMKAVLEHFSTSVTDTFSSHIEKMGNIIEQTIASQKEIKQQLADFSVTLKKQLHSQSEMINKTNRAGEILGQSLDSLETISQKLKAASEDIGSAAELLERSANSAKEGQAVLQETMQQQIDNMTATRQELDDTWQTITKNAKFLVEKIRETVNELTTGVQDNLIKALDSFDGKIAEVVERFSGTLFEAGETIDDMPGLVADINDSLSIISQGISEQKEILKEIRETSQSVFSENVQMTCDASKSLGECTVNIAATADQLNQFLNAFSQKFKYSAETFEQQNKDAISGFNQLTVQMTNELSNIKRLFQAEGAVYEALKSLELQIESASIRAENEQKIENSIATPIKQMSERLDKLAALLSTQVKNGDGHGKVDIEVLNHFKTMNSHLRFISDNLKTDTSLKIESLSSSLDNLTKLIEKMNSSEGGEVYDSKWWPFRGVKK